MNISLRKTSNLGWNFWSKQDTQAHGPFRVAISLVVRSPSGMWDIQVQVTVSDQAEQGLSMGYGGGGCGLHWFFVGF